MTKHPFAFLLLLLVIASLACDLPSISPSEEKTGIQAVLVSPLSGSGTFKIRVIYYHRLGDPVQKITCSVNGDEFTLQPTNQIGNQEFVTDYIVTEPGKYTVSCGSGLKDTNWDSFTVVKPDDTSTTGLKKHKPGEITSGGMWMLFDQATSDLAGYAVPRQCLPGVNYTHVGGTSNLDVAADGTLSGKCRLSNFGGGSQLSGSLTGKWDAESGEVSFELETETVNTVSITRNGVQISGVSTNTTIYTGTGKFTSEYQATGMAQWQTSCVTTNPEATVCMSKERPSVKANGTIPWQINFNP
jgi:hypothetical protein